MKITKRNFEDEEMTHQLFKTIRQETKRRNAYVNNISTDIKLSKTQLSKIIQSGGFLGALLGKLADSFMKVCVPLATMSSASTIDGAIQRKMRARGVARAEKRNQLIYFKWRYEWYF